MALFFHLYINFVGLWFNPILLKKTEIDWMWIHFVLQQTFFFCMCIDQIYFFRQITTFIKVRMAFAFGLQTLHSIDVTKIFRLKGLKAKNKGHTNFYECCDLTKKVYLDCTLRKTYVFHKP